MPSQETEEEQNGGESGRSWSINKKQMTYVCLRHRLIYQQPSDLPRLGRYSSFTIPYGSSISTDSQDLGVYFSIYVRQCTYTVPFAIPNSASFVPSISVTALSKKMHHSNPEKKKKRSTAHNIRSSFQVVYLLGDKFIQAKQDDVVHSSTQKNDRKSPIH